MKKKDMEKYQGLLSQTSLSEAEMKFIASLERSAQLERLMNIIYVIAFIVLAILIMRYYL